MAREATISVRVDPETKEAAEQAARDDDRTLSQWVHRLIVAALKQQRRASDTPPGA